jgi:hypothetical protein
MIHTKIETLEEASKDFSNRQSFSSCLFLHTGAELAEQKSSRRDQHFGAARRKSSERHERTTPPAPWLAKKIQGLHQGHNHVGMKTRASVETRSAEIRRTTGSREGKSKQRDGSRTEKGAQRSCARERLTLELAGERQRLERRIENRICCNSTVSKYEDRGEILEANKSAWMALESRPAGKNKSENSTHVRTGSKIHEQKSVELQI